MSDVRQYDFSCIGQFCYCLCLKSIATAHVINTCLIKKFGNLFPVSIPITVYSSLWKSRGEINAAAI